jgi:Dolichyl-phosphate-mannose-protein mannosyltransferase
MVLNNTGSIHKESEEGVGVLKTEHMSLWQELTWFSLIMLIALTLRLLFVRSFPTTPVSDFLSLLDFAVVFREDWLARDAWQWQFFAPGLPMTLSVILELVPGSPATVGRLATAVSTACIPALPYFFWKDVFTPRTRIIAALLLAILPAQILFSSVLAQDNWIILPTVAVACLAVRSLVKEEENGRPVLSALFYGAAVATRQDMMLVLLPAAMIAILGGRKDSRLRNLLIGISIIGIIFTALIVQRGMATGTYKLTSEHFGKAMLGAYVPGAGTGWVDPIPYVQSAYPELINGENVERQLAQEALGIAWHEFARRPAFHVIRIFGSTLTNFFEADQQLALWSLSEGVLPIESQEKASLFTKNLLPLFQVYSIMINMLFAGSLFFALKQRHILKWISPILTTIVLKIGLHAVVVSQSRFYLVVMALEILVIAIVWNSLALKDTWKVSVRSLILGTLSILLMLAARNYAKQYIKSHDILQQSHYESFSDGEVTISSLGKLSISSR